ncbi:MAG: hypothetical protein ACOVN7_01330 [Rubrivivax sp.]
MKLEIQEADPQGPDALLLLREAAIEARRSYPELHRPDDPWPTHRPTPPRGAYFIAYAESIPVAMGSHHPMDGRLSEVRRIEPYGAYRDDPTSVCFAKTISTSAA